MRNKIFFDANVLIDLINSGNEGYESVLFMFNQLKKRNSSLYCSPTSFAITYFFLNKQIKQKERLNKITKGFFSAFIFTREDSNIMEKVLQSDFEDLEDALQYYSAVDEGVNIIITKNFFDFKNSSIPVYHPLQYINEFLL